MLAEREAELDDFEVVHFPGHTLSMQDFVIAAQKATGRQMRLKAFPRWMFYLGGLFSSTIRATWEMLYLWDVPHQLVEERLRLLAGEVEHTPLEVALGECREP